MLTTMGLQKYYMIFLFLGLNSIIYIFVYVAIYTNVMSKLRTVHISRPLQLQAQRSVKDVNCSAIFANDKHEIDKATKINFDSSNQELINDTMYIELTKQCDNFKTIRGYFDNRHVTPEELNFPIAFSILLYKDVEQTERLLRAIYKPHNIYCIHIDADSNPTIHAAIAAIADCFPNVFVVSRKEYIVYAGFTRLQADINCMADLLRVTVQWKYFINLPSQQFPIKTNAEMVKILKSYNGSNNIEALTGAKRIMNRVEHSHIYKYLSPDIKPKLLNSKTKKDSPPFNMTIVKGSAYGVFSRDFVKYICENRTARVLLDYLRDTYSPDEYYWATLNYNPHIGAPGSSKADKSRNPWLASYAAWAGVDPCKGKVVRGICIFGVQDLPFLITKDHLFVNKFYYDFQPIALQCMEEWYLNKSLTDFPVELNLARYMTKHR